MKTVEETVSADVGVIIGRFQVHNLHAAHIDLIQTVCDKHKKVIVCLGLSPLKATKNNPLDFESRKKMIEAKFPEVLVIYAKDCVDDKVWTKKIDTQIKDLIGANHSVILYGSRDSFIKHYSGVFKTQELVPTINVSGSELRKDISRSVMNTSDFRAGAIWATQQQFDTCYPTVDIAIFNEDGTQILMARKEGEIDFSTP
jgi:bifunctional NMN adenylyltransferase/nudix hydrolase